MRPVREEELMRLWPALRAAKLMSSPEELTRFREAGPWRVRVSDAGEGLVLDRWRGHLDVLAIRGLWAAEHRIGALVNEASAVARAQGFSAVLSPLLSLSALQPYLAAGMSERERIVALQAHADDIADLPPEPSLRVRAGSAADLGALEHLDASCFDEFWRYGPKELGEALREGQLFVAERDGVTLGYHTIAHHGATSTVGRLAVAAALRRRGVGRTLLADAGSRALRSCAFGLTLCTQSSNSASRALYSATGFAEVGEEYALAILDV